MSENPHADLTRFLDAQREAAWDLGRRYGLELAALRIENLGGQFAFRINPIDAARELRALKDQMTMNKQPDLSNVTERCAVLEAEVRKIHTRLAEMGFENTDDDINGFALVDEMDEVYDDLSHLVVRLDAEKLV